MPQTDIIARIREGDRETFNAFCRERYASLIAFARLFLSRINGTWADDVVQDVLFGLWQNRASLYDDGSSLQAYLLRSVYHRCLNYLKKERRSEALDADDESKMVSRMAEYYDPDRNPVILNLFNTDLRSSLSRAIEALPPQRREVFTLSYLNQLTNREIGEKLGISLSTVENHMYLALKQLRAILKNN